MKLHTLYLTLISLLLIIIFAGAYKFIFQGATTQSTDQRTLILLNDNERQLVLSEMRHFLMSVQQITAAINNNDFKSIASAAAQSGNAVQQGMPGSLVGKLPIEFKQLGYDTHSRFDQISLDATSFSDREHTLEQLGELLNNCVACHETYQIRLEPAIGD